MNKVLIIGLGLMMAQVAGPVPWVGAATAAAGPEAHWAWQPVAEVKPPDTPRASPHPIDRFIQSKLKLQGLSPSPRADRRTLIRRLSFDLHGLPPSPEAIRLFVRDPRPHAEAWRDLVNTMLASPHYGERYAQHWLDIAHYADTHGFERDKRRDHAWRYRDYVIRALNNDKPYDRFLNEQLAGDALWPGNPEALVATGFLAAGPFDFVGQVETKNPRLNRVARSLDLDDMVTQVMTATVGMTIHCARCHDHKLDPMTQKEYFQLSAVFAGVKRGDRSMHQVKMDQLSAEMDELSRRLYRAEPGLDLAQVVGGGDGDNPGTPNQGIDPRTGQAASKPLGFLQDVKPNQAASSPSRYVDAVFIPKTPDDPVGIPVTTSGVKLDQVPGADGKAWDLIRLGPVNSQHSSKLGGLDFADPQHTFLGLHANAGITFDLAECRKTVGSPELRFTAQVGYFGKAEDQYFADASVLIDGQPRVTLRHLKRKDGLKAIDLPIPDTARYLTLLSTGGGNGISMDQIGFGNPKLLPPNHQLSQQERSRLAQWRQDRQASQARLASLEKLKVYSVVPLETIPEVRVLVRGDPESPTGEALSPGTLTVLPMLKSDLGNARSPEAKRRSALAGWITHPDNPLTRRVIVNRLWHWHFGKGIVVTPSDFGQGGGQPSHPELLDWLAGELLRKNWSLKAMHRLILTSETYQQASHYKTEDKGQAVDANNRWLWRQIARRLEAEAIRDTVLAVSGKLNRDRFGPGFEDFRYEEAYAPIYTYVTADQPSLWRRSIYRYRVRTTPDQFLTTLDCPDLAILTPRRITTTTPLQSLALYNNDFILRQAQYLAARLEAEAGPEPARQVTQAFHLAFGRGPTAAERALSSEFVEQSGLFAFARSLFNANEFVYVD